MNCSQELLQRLKTAFCTENNSEIARFLRVSRSAVNDWDKTRSSMDWPSVFKIIDHLALDETFFVLEMVKEKQKNFRVFNALKDMKTIKNNTKNIKNTRRHAQ